MGAPRITFLGAADTVTGSRYLVETDAVRVLVDCGLFQGYKVLRERNRESFAVRPGSIDATFVTNGELSAADTLRRRIRHELRWDVRVPEHGEEVEVTVGRSG